MLYLKEIYSWIADGFNADRGLAAPKVVQVQTHDDIAESDAVEDIASLKSRIKLYNATFWSRLWARGIDVSLVLTVGSFVLEAMPTLNLTGSGYITKLFIDLISQAMTFAILVIAYDYLFLLLFGATIGKMIFGIKVFSRDLMPLSSREAYGRSLSLLTYGLGFMVWFPWLQIMLAYGAFKYIKINKTAEWDKGLYLVKQRKIGVLRWLIGAVLSVSLLVIIVGLQQYAKKLTKDKVTEEVMQEYKNTK